MRKHKVPDVIKNVIEERSKKDCIAGVTEPYMRSAFIPFLLKDVLDNNGQLDPRMHKVSQEYHKILCGLSNFNDWTPDIYWYLWKLLLYIEYYQSLEDMKQYSLTDQKINKSQYRVGEFIVTVPNLSEDRPSVRENDKIDLLQINGVNKCEGIVSWVGKDYVSVEVNAEFRNRFTTDQRFNVEFRCDTRATKCQNYTLDKLYQYNMSSMFFPYKNVTTSYSKDTFIKWINKNIEKNPEQMQAVRNILKKTSHPAPYILFGPPGTGKTSTLVEAICQIMIKNSSTRILICTPSNSAADEIVERLIKIMRKIKSPRFVLNDDTIYRMYSVSRKASDVKPQLKLVSNFGDTKTVSLSKEVFLTKKIIVVTLATCTRLHSYNLRADHFSYLFIDEAGQATELETLIPFILMSGLDSKKEWQMSGQVVIAGDPKQLGPHCRSKLAEPLLEKSMLERLMEWGPYLRNKEIKKYDQLYVTKLVQNYRCHNSILYVPNKLFYDGELVAKGGEHTTRALNWSKLPNKDFPVIFHAVRGRETRKDYSPSVCNQQEIKIIVDYVKKLLRSELGGRKVCTNDIGIVTPYRLQRSMIHQAFQNRIFAEISVGTVEAFQGQEKDIIIISTVRSCMYQHKNRFYVGFFSNPKRFNVALTRAKALLIVIGHPDILQQDRCWGEFIRYCYYHGACQGEKVILDPSYHNLDIRQCADKLKNRTYEKPNTDEPIVEDPISSSEYREQTNTNRRRRLPIGPLPKIVIDSENTMKLLLRDWNDDRMQKEENWRNHGLLSDGSDDDYSTDEDEQLFDDEQADDELLDTSFQADDLSIDCLKNLMIDEKEFESELLVRMAKLKMND